MEAGGWGQSKWRRMNEAGQKIPDQGGHQIRSTHSGCAGLRVLHRHGGHRSCPVEPAWGRLGVSGRSGRGLLAEHRSQGTAVAVDDFPGQSGSNVRRHLYRFNLRRGCICESSAGKGSRLRKASDRQGFLRRAAHQFNDCHADRESGGYCRCRTDLPRLGSIHSRREGHGSAECLGARGWRVHSGSLPRSDLQTPGGAPAKGLCRLAPA